MRCEITTRTLLGKVVYVYIVTANVTALASISYSRWRKFYNSDTVYSELADRLSPTCNHYNYILPVSQNENANACSSLYIRLEVSRQPGENSISRYGNDQPLWIGLTSANWRQRNLAVRPRTEFNSLYGPGGRSHSDSDVIGKLPALLYGLTGRSLLRSDVNGHRPNKALNRPGPLFVAMSDVMETNRVLSSLQGRLWRHRTRCGQED